MVFPQVDASIYLAAAFLPTRGWAAIMADGLSCQQQMMAVTGALASPPLTPSASVKEMEPARSESKAPARSKTAA
jgi:hypothetical protein